MATQASKNSSEISYKIDAKSKKLSTNSTAPMMMAIMWNICKCSVSTGGVGEEKRLVLMKEVCLILVWDLVDFAY